MPLSGDARRARLAGARLYLVCDARPGDRRVEDVVGPALVAGVDVVQLRDHGLTDDDGIRAAAATFRRLADREGCLFILNDRPDLAVEVGADGVHVGQEDMPVAQARAIVGADAIVGLSTHTPAQVDAAEHVDYISVGPIEMTPTKPGRPATGLALVEYAAAHARAPFFAIGGVTTGNIGDAVAAGARRAVVVRAIAEATDSGAAARDLRAVLEAAIAGEEARVGTA